MNLLTDEQWQQLLVAAGNRAGAIQACAIAMGVVDAPPPPPVVERPSSGVRTSYPDNDPQPNVAVEGADADLDDSSENDLDALEDVDEDEEGKGNA